MNKRDVDRLNYLRAAVCGRIAASHLDSVDAIRADLSKTVAPTICLKIFYGMLQDGWTIERMRSANPIEVTP